MERSDMAEAESEGPFSRLFGPTRTISFTDAVFAIVITILVLGIEAPPTSSLSPEELAEVRKRVAHELWVYFVSFCIVGSYWIQNTMLFRSLRQIDRPMVVLNLAYLLPITLLPFVTQVMGAHRTEWWGVALFGVVNLAAVIIYAVAWWHAVRSLESKEGRPAAQLGRRVAPKIMLYTVVILVGVVVATVDITAGISVFLLMPATFLYSYLRSADE